MEPDGLLCETLKKEEGEDTTARSLHRYTHHPLCLKTMMRFFFIFLPLPLNLDHLRHGKKEKKEKKNENKLKKKENATICEYPC